MNIKLLNLILFSISIFLKVGLINSKIDQDVYATYLSHVTKNICNKLSHINLEHLSVRTIDFDIKSIQEALKNKSKYFSKLLITYYYIVELINYLFIEVLQIFTEHVKIIIDVCERYYKNNLFENATNCTIVLLNTTKNTNVMFKYLYRAIQFIEYLDVNFVKTRKSMKRPKTVIDEIYIVQNYTSSMKTSEMLNYVNNDKSINILVAIEDYTDINNFINKVIEITDNFFKNNNTIINSMMRVNLQKNYYDEYITNNYEINFVDFVSEKLNNYCLNIIGNYYFNIGFNQLLNPSTAELKPPQHTDFPQESAIQILNTLFREGNWKLLNHISIISHDEIITTERIIRDPVDKFNFNLKKKHFIQLIRCRYTEVLKIYNTYISAIIQICRNELNELNDTNLDGIIDYITRFFNAVKDSKEMFTYMLLALDKLKATSIWEVMYNSHACLSQTYDLLSNLFPKIEQLNLTQSDFLNLSTEDLKLKANNFLFDFQSARKQFDSTFTEGKVHFRKRCLFKEDFLNKNQLLQSWKDIVLFSITYKITKSQKVLNEYSLNEFINYYKNAITSEYSCLGFNKINSSN